MHTRSLCTSGAGREPPAATHRMHKTTNTRQAARIPHSPAILPHLAVSNPPLRPNAGVQQSHTRNAQLKHPESRAPTTHTAAAFYAPTCHDHALRYIHAGLSTAKALHSKYTGTSARTPLRRRRLLQQHQAQRQRWPDQTQLPTPSTPAHNPQGLLLLRMGLGQPGWLCSGVCLCCHSAGCWRDRLLGSGCWCGRRTGLLLLLLQGGHAGGHHARDCGEGVWRQRCCWC